jgi:hypothetical protein
VFLNAGFPSLEPVQVITIGPVMTN